MCAGVRTREKRKSELYQGAIRKRTRRKKEGNINYKQNGRRRASTDRAPETMQKRRKKNADVYMCLKLHEEENEKKKAKGGEEEEEGCTYTNAIERVCAQVEKKRRESFLVRTACCYVIVDENEVHLYNHHHHLFF